MKYRLFWTPEAEQELERIIENETRFKALLGETVRTINRQLISNPWSIGESRPDGTRIASERPLAFYFEILEDVRTVILLVIWRIDRR